MVLTYHGILPAGYKIVDRVLDGNLVSAELFRRQLRFLKSQFNVISPEEFLLWCEAGHELPPRSVLLTCDDGLRNSLDMLPILQEAGFTCLLFVTGASLTASPTMLWHEELYLMLLAAPDRITLELREIGLEATASRRQKVSLWWTLMKILSRYDSNCRSAQLGTIRMQLDLSERWNAEYLECPVLTRRFAVLNQCELRGLSRAGMCIGAHSLSHPPLSQCSAELAWSEISESKRNLEQVLEREIWAFAYPFGNSLSVTTREVRMAEQAGFRCAFLNVSTGSRNSTRQFALPRVHITAEMTMPELEARIAGFHQAVQQVFRRTHLDDAVESSA